MKFIRSQVRLTGMLFLVLGGMLAYFQPVRAFEPTPGYWYTETLVVGAVELPPGVIFHTSNPSTESRAVLTLENENDTLLFVLPLNYKDVLVMETPDPQWESRVNLAHEVASYLVTPQRPVYLEMDALTDLDQNLVDRNVLSYTPPPADITIPDPQTTELLLVYGEQVILVPITLAYALNPNFDKEAEDDSVWMASVQATDDARVAITQQVVQAEQQAARNNLLVIGLAGLAVLTLVSWLVWKILARGK